MLILNAAKNECMIAVPSGASHEQLAEGKRAPCEEDPKETGQVQAASQDSVAKNAF